MSRPGCPDGDDVARTVECVGGGLTEEERKALEINEVTYLWPQTGAKHIIQQSTTNRKAWP